MVGRGVDTVCYSIMKIRFYLHGINPDRRISDKFGMEEIPVVSFDN
jgi:hypothetical protein